MLLDGGDLKLSLSRQLQGFCNHDWNSRVPMGTSFKQAPVSMWTFQSLQSFVQTRSALAWQLQKWLSVDNRVLRYLAKVIPRMCAGSEIDKLNALLTGGRYPTDLFRETYKWTFKPFKEMRRNIFTFSGDDFNTYFEDFVEILQSVQSLQIYRQFSGLKLRGTWENPCT